MPARRQSSRSPARRQKVSGHHLADGQRTSHGQEQTEEVTVSSKDFPSDSFSLVTPPVVTGGGFRCLFIRIGMSTYIIFLWLVPIVAFWFNDFPSPECVKLSNLISHRRNVYGALILISFLSCCTSILFVLREYAMFLSVLRRMPRPVIDATYMLLALFAFGVFPCVLLTMAFDLQPPMSSVGEGTATPTLAPSISAQPRESQRQWLLSAAHQLHTVAALIGLTLCGVFMYVYLKHVHPFVAAEERRRTQAQSSTPEQLLHDSPNPRRFSNSNTNQDIVWRKRSALMLLLGCAVGFVAEGLLLVNAVTGNVNVGSLNSNGSYFGPLLTALFDPCGIGRLELAAEMLILTGAGCFGLFGFSEAMAELDAFEPITPKMSTLA